MNDLKLITVLFFVTGCSSNEFIKYKNGLQYQIIHSGGTVFPKYGETIKMHMKQVYRDSLLGSTWDNVPAYPSYDSVHLSKDSYYLLGRASIGDSIIFKALSDSAFKDKWPPFAKKGEWLYTYIKIIDILGVRHDVESDRQMEIKKHQPSDSFSK